MILYLLLKKNIQKINLILLYLNYLKLLLKYFQKLFHPEEIKEENGVIKYIINIKLNAYLSGKNTTFFLIDYNKKNIISNECYKLFLECQTKIAIILNTYLNNNEFDYNSFLL